MKHHEPGHPPMLSRGDLECGRMREVYARLVADPTRALSDEQLEASLAETLQARPPKAGWWVFAYGSLLWNPLFPVAEMKVATLHGWHRRFCLWSLATRGTPQKPGLVLGLEPGGSCRGVALRLSAELAVDELKLLWRREMVVGAYRPAWVHVDAGGHELTALTFLVRHDHPQYTGKIATACEVEALAEAVGQFGSSFDYLERTRIALIAHGVVDNYLEGLADGVARLRDR